MKILFIYPDMITRDPDWAGYYYEGLAMLSAAARAAGHDTALLHVFQPLSDEEILEWAQEESRGAPALVAFSATTNQFPHVERWAPLIKEATGLPTICGGMHPTLSPDRALASPGLDLICRGDGEAALSELATRLEQGERPAGIRGIHGTGVAGDTGVALHTDVNRTPHPHWDIFPGYHKLEAIRQKIGILMGSRGCPYSCAYCCNQALIKQGKEQCLGPYMRFKEVPRFIAEIKEYLRRFPRTEGLFFEDDIFGVWKKWLRQFLPAYKEEIGLPFGCNTRPNLVDAEMADLLAQAGCKRVHMAIESGNPEVRNRILNRNLSQDAIIDAFRLFKERQVQVMSYNIIGSPQETAANILDTIKLNAQIDPDWIQHTIFYPYEGTPLGEQAHQAGLVARDRVVTDYFRDTILEQPSIHRSQVVMFQLHFKGLVRHYRRLGTWPRPLGALAARVTDLFLLWRGAPLLLKWRGRQGSAPPTS